MTDRFAAVVAIPAKDEAELLPLCVGALARQSGIAAEDVAIVVSCNNCSDDSAAIVRGMAEDMPCTLIVAEVTLPPEIAHAGGARRHAMNAARTYCAAGGIILTTDADGIPDPDWIAATCAAFVSEVAAVAGRVSTDWETLNRFPADVLDVGAREWDYQLLSAELEALTDPEAHDPWPRHNQTCGANMAIRAGWYDTIGGLPAIRTGEDGAMFAAVRARDGRVRHDMASHVMVSARLVGRAQGGMADALAARHGDAYLCDDLLEPADDLLRRNRWRHAARDAFGALTLADWARSVGIAGDTAARAATMPYFGAAWAFLESRVPQLAKRRLPASDIDGQLSRIRHLLDRVRTPMETIDAA